MTPKRLMVGMNAQDARRILRDKGWLVAAKHGDDESWVKEGQRGIICWAGEHPEQAVITKIFYLDFLKEGQL